MLSGRSTTSNSTNHRRQWSEGIMPTDKSRRLYKGRKNEIL